MRTRVVPRRPAWSPVERNTAGWTLEAEPAQAPEHRAWWSLLGQWLQARGTPRHHREHVHRRAAPTRKEPRATPDRCAENATGETEPFRELRGVIQKPQVEEREDQEDHGVGRESDAQEEIEESMRDPRDPESAPEMRGSPQGV